MKISRIVITLAAFVLLFVAAGQTNGQEAGSGAATEVASKPTASFQTNLDTALIVAVQADRNILLDFYTDW